MNTTKTSNRSTQNRADMHAAEPYAVLSRRNTMLTFYYDDLKKLVIAMMSARSIKTMNAGAVIPKKYKSSFLIAHLPHALQSPALHIGLTAAPN